MKITYDQALELAQRCVDEKGEDYVYVDPDGVSSITGEAQCVYWDVDKSIPSCIVGHALYYAGISAEKLAINNTAPASEFGEFFADEDTQTLMCQMQYYQDNGTPWGKAVATAKESVEKKARRFGEK